MKNETKKLGLVRPYTTLFIIALIIALLGRGGLFVMELTGTLSFDYISASGVPILDVICSILTGSAFVAFLFVAGLVLCLSTAGVVLYGLLFAQENDGRAHAFKAFLCGWATALVAIICALIVMNGILSAVQVASMSSKLPALPVLAVALVVFAAFLGTLLAAASLVVCACIARARSGKSLYKNLIVATLVCGIAVCVLTVGTFTSINTSSINITQLGIWFGLDIVVNIIGMMVASILTRRADSVIVVEHADHLSKILGDEKTKQEV